MDKQWETLHLADLQILPSGNDICSGLYWLTDLKRIALYVRMYIYRSVCVLALTGVEDLVRIAASCLTWFEIVILVYSNTLYVLAILFER